MRVLLSSTTTNFDSGASWSMVYLANELKNRGINPIVLLPADGEIRKFLEGNKIKYYIVNQCTTYDWVNNIGYKFEGNLSKIYDRMKHRIVNSIAVIKISKIIIQEKIDIVHINSLTGYIPAKSAKLMNKKLVWHIREFLEEDLSLSFINPDKSFKLINKSDKVICVSKEIKNKYDKLLKCPITVIYNGINIESYYIEKDIFNNENINISILGRITEKKGQLDLIKAVERLIKEGYTNIRCKIVGIIDNNCKYQQKIQQFIRENLIEDNVKLIGFEKNAKKILKYTDILAVCSKAEAFGRVTIEGMVSGSLVIGANSGGTKEIIEDNNNGLLYKQEEYLDLYNKLKYAINNKEEMKRIAINGQQYAIDKFSDKCNAESIIEEYYKLMEDEEI